jgi:hypothetical protein
VSSAIKEHGKQRVALRLAPDVMQTAKEAVGLGIAPTATAFIEDSIRARRREVRHALMTRMAEEAMADPEFVADMRETMDAFEPSTSEGWPET